MLMLMVVLHVGLITYVVVVVVVAWDQLTRVIYNNTISGCRD
jgi:ABC-type dipeptide/oligopeptide/nickel transport system permease subunit